MSDIRKRVGRKGTTYQVRYPSNKTKSGYAYATFDTMKEARAFVESGKTSQSSQSIYGERYTVAEAADRWLKICEKEGLNGREPVSKYTYQNYEYRAEFIKSYDWPGRVQEIVPPDVVAFRSWLLNSGVSRETAGKVLSTLHSVFKEMTVRGSLTHNPATGICVRQESRYKDPVVIPTKSDVIALLKAADELANSKNSQIERAWRRYRPMLYLAADSGMRPQEYLALAHSAIRDAGVYVDRAIAGCGTEMSVTKTPAGRRFIGLSAETLDMVRHYAENHADTNDYELVFPAKGGRWQSRRNWQRRGFNVACEKADLMVTAEEDDRKVVRPKYRPYDLRHFFASMLIEKETNLKKIQTLMGHTNIQQTLDVYGHLLEDKAGEEAVPRGMLTDLTEEGCGVSVATLH